MMTQNEYNFLTGGEVTGVSKERVFNFCRSFGWCAGLDMEGRPVLTKRGIKAVKAFQSDENYKRIDCI